MFPGSIAGPSARAGQGTASNAATKVALSHRNMRTRARSRLGSLFIGRDLAVVDPLLVHPFPPDPLFSRERIDSVRSCRGLADETRPIFSEAMRRADGCERQSEGEARK